MSAGRPFDARWRRSAFVAALVLLVLAVHGGLVALAIASERRSVKDRLWLETREVTRLAVARLDAVLVPLLVAESARPSAHFDLVSPQPGAVDAEGQPLPPGRALVTSPLVLAELPLRLLHFTWDADGGLRSPQVPRATLRRIDPEAEPTLERSAARLEDLGATVPADVWRSLWQRAGGAPSPLLTGDGAPPREWPATGLASRLAGAADDGRGSGMRPHFLPVAQKGAPVLVLARRGEVDGKHRLEGVWIDWPKLRAQLLEEVADELAGRGVRLRPLTEVPDARQDQRLASLPAALLVGELEWPPPLGWSPTRRALAVASAIVLGALALGAWALFAAWELGERRARFASGVTHELRTPLTTFQLYSDLLADDRIADPVRRREALETLRSESARLARVVENVLAQARLERGSAHLARQPFDLGVLLLRLVPHFARRCREAGLELDVHLIEEGEAVCVGDAGAVEQVLVNLVDNAAKYAASGVPPRVELDVVRDGGAFVVRVRDHGPGVPEARRTELFVPFSRAGARPHIQGLGLGLSLSRDLARGMGAELTHDAPPDGGARFSLRLAAAGPAERAAR